VTPQHCLNDETVLGFLEGGLTTAELARVESHALACPTCQELISAGLNAASAHQGGPQVGGRATERQELSCRFLVPLLKLAAQRLPAADVSEFLRSWQTSVADLKDESGWVSRRFCEALVEWLAGLVGVDAIIEQTLRDSYSPETMGLLYPFIRAFGSPRVGYARLPSFVSLLNRASDVEVLMRGRNRATITYRPKSEATRERSPLICRVRRAQIGAGPTVWGLPVAIVEEAECQAHGGDRCVYQVTWVEPTRWWRSVLGGALLAAVAWLVSGHSGAVSILAMATGVVVVHWWGARRDLQEQRLLEDLKMSQLGRVDRLHPRGELGSPPSIALAPAPEGGSPLVEASTSLPQSGQLLAGRYRIGPLLGAGGMGFVFRATDETTNQPVALKVLRPELSVNPRWVERMECEVRIARAIADPHVCRMISFGLVEGYHFLTMELATGTLRHELRGGASAKPWGARVDDAKAIVLGLVAIHRAGIVHRDLTPQNILRFSDGRLAIADFGLAMDQPGKTTQIAGTPNHIAPEVLQGGKVTYASDVWQLGVIVHELLYGRRPTPEEIADGPPSSPVDEERSGAGEAALRALCAACMHRDPTQRPENAEAVAIRFPTIADVATSSNRLTN
jgi:Protein kinase domain